MADFQESSQLNLWTYSSKQHLSWLRSKANHTARTQLLADDTTTPPDPTEAKFFARGWNKRFVAGQEGTTTDYTTLDEQGPWENAKHKPFLTAAEEAAMVQYYASKLGKLIGPRPALLRLKRNSKVTATAALLYRRFFLSNSVMIYDPKAIMVAAAFLASKVSVANKRMSCLPT